MLWLLGVVLCALGSVASSAGLALQKHSHNIGESEKSLHERWIWWVGFVLAVLVSGLLESVSFALAPLSLLAPMFGFSIVANAIIASFCLGERLTVLDG